MFCNVIFSLSSNAQSISVATNLAFDKKNLIKLRKPKMVLFQAKADSTLLHPLNFIGNYNFFVSYQAINYFLITFKSELIDLKTICEK